MLIQVYMYTLVFHWSRLSVPAPYFLSPCLSLNLELTNRLGWLSSELQRPDLLMTDYLNWGPPACLGSVLQSELSFYKWTVPSVWLFSGMWRVFFWESGDCFNDKIIPCVEEGGQPLVLAFSLALMAVCPACIHSGQPRDSTKLTLIVLLII